MTNLPHKLHIFKVEHTSGQITPHENKSFGSMQDIYTYLDNQGWIINIDRLKNLEVPEFGGMLSGDYGYVVSSNFN